MSGPEIDNQTDFAVAPHTLLGPEGEQLVVIVKGSFGLDEASLLQPLTEPRGVRFGDDWWGDPATTPIRYPSDACGLKPGTDVVVVAEGHAPGGRAVDTFDVAVRVGALEKTLRVFGLRVWQQDGQGLSAPRPTALQPIRYDHAWGGLDPTDPSVGEPRNPVGRGVVADPSTLTHQPAPAVEDPLHPIATASAGPPPAGFGAIGPHWEPRRRYHGTYDEAWQRNQAPLLPSDHDPRANLCATPELVATPHLLGGEEVGLHNLHPGGGSLAFTLPRMAPVLTLERHGRADRALRPPLDTVVIDTLAPAEGPVTVELVWRSVVAMPRFQRHLRVTVATA